MSIEFHCEHCNKLVLAPETDGGRRAKCPYCKGVCYVPMPHDEIEEVPMEPLDQEDERRRARGIHETAALQRALLRERPGPDRAGKGRSVGPAASGPGAVESRHTTAEVKDLVIAYVEAMSGGRLEDADGIAGQLSASREEVLRFIESIAMDQLAASDLPAVPRPVLVGFLKQLRGRL